MIDIAGCPGWPTTVLIVGLVLSGGLTFVGLAWAAAWRFRDR